MVGGKPIVGLAGGIGSGKSFVARLFGEMGCRVIDSDALAGKAYQDPRVREALREWWGPEVIAADGRVNRSAIARRIFGNPEDRARLQALIHPIVDAARQRELESAASDPAVLAFVWDSPLLFETQLNRACDAIVFVDAPAQERIERVGQTRGWAADEWARRENLQWPLDKKRELSDYVVNNTADAAQVRDQVRELFPRILAAIAQRSEASQDARGRHSQGGAS